MLTASTVGFFMNRQKASGTNPIGVSAQSQNSEAEIEPYVLSPEIAIAEDAFGRELEEQVAAINATQDETDGLTGDAAGEQHQERGSEPDQRATDGGGGRLLLVRWKFTLARWPLYRRMSSTICPSGNASAVPQRAD